MVNFEEDINNCLRVLHDGGLILYPTDTIWGIGCDATNEKAVSRIYQLKQRPDEKSMIVLLADERDINTYIANPNPEVFDYLEKTTKPTTVIYDGAISVAENLISNENTLAIRVIKEEFCKHLIKRFRKPIVSTSANISGMPSPTSFSTVDPVIQKGVDYVVKYRQDDNSTSSPSSIIKMESDGRITIIRP